MILTITTRRKHGSTACRSESFRRICYTNLNTGYYSNGQINVFYILFNILIVLKYTNLIVRRETFILLNINALVSMICKMYRK